MKYLDTRGMALARRLCAMQIVVALIATLVCYALAGAESARAALIGGLAAAVPAFFFAWRVFSTPPGSSPSRMLGALYLGEAGKLLLIVVVFGLGVKWYAQYLLPLLLTYMACLAVYWGGMVYLLSIDDRNHHGGI